MKQSGSHRWFFLLFSALFTSSPLQLIPISQNYLAPTRSGIGVKAELEIGDTFTFSRSVSPAQQQGYAGFSEDLNWPHLNKELAQKLFKTDAAILHGMHTSSCSLDLLAWQLGEKVRTSYEIISEDAVFIKPVVVGEEVQYQVRVEEKKEDGKVFARIVGLNAKKQEVLVQNVCLKKNGQLDKSRVSNAAALGKKVNFMETENAQRYLSGKYAQLLPTERVMPPVYLVGKKDHYQWEMTAGKTIDLAALFESPSFSEVKVAKAIMTYVAQKMYPSSLFVKSAITEINAPIPIAAMLKIDAVVKNYEKEGKKFGRSLTELTVSDQDAGTVLFKGKIEMQAYPFTLLELEELAASKDREKNLTAILNGKNQFEYEMIFRAILKPDISGVEFIDEYHAAIEKDPAKTLEKARELLSGMKLKVAVVGVGGIGGGVAEALGKIQGVQLAVLTRDDEGSVRLKEKFANAGILEYHDIRIKDSKDRNSYVDAIIEAKKAMGGLDVLFIGTGMADARDTLLPVAPKGKSKDDLTVDDLKKHLELAHKIHHVNQELVQAVFSTAAFLNAKNIFVVGSVHSKHMGNPGVVNYSQSKAANSRLAEAYPGNSIKWTSAMGISIQGDYILSSMTASVAMVVLKTTKLGFFLTPKQVAEAATWLIAFHNYKELGFFKKDKEGALVPDWQKAVPTGAHQVDLPGDKSVARLKVAALKPIAAAEKVNVKVDAVANAASLIAVSI